MSTVSGQSEGKIALINSLEGCLNLEQFSTHIKQRKTDQNSICAPNMGKLWWDASSNKL